MPIVEALPEEPSYIEDDDLDPNTVSSFVSEHLTTAVDAGRNGNNEEEETFVSEQLSTSKEKHTVSNAETASKNLNQTPLTPEESKDSAVAEPTSKYS